MSETIATTTFETEPRWDEPQPDANKTDDTAEAIPEWYRETLNLILANADVVGPCKWMGNAEVRLGTAMWKHAMPTPENVHLVMADVLEFLANVANKKVQEEENPEEEQPEEVEVDEEQEAVQKEEKNQKNNTEIKNVKAEGSAKAEEQPKVEVAQRQTQPGSVEAPSVVAAQAEVAAIFAATTPKKTTRVVPKIQPAKPLARPVVAASPKKPEPQITPVVVSAKPEARAPTLVAVETIQEPEPELPLAEAQLDEIGSPIEESPIETVQPVLELEIPGVDTTVVDVIKAPVLFEAEEETQDLETTVIAKEISVLAHQEPDIVMANYESDTAIVTDQLEASSTDDLFEVEEEVVADCHKEDVLEFSADELGTEEASIDQPEDEPELEAETEEVLLELTELIGSIEPETAEIVNEILGKIIDVAAKLEAVDDENIITEAEAQEEVEELFTELFDELIIEYTPELIEALASPEFRWRVIAEIKRLQIEEEDESPQAGSRRITPKQPLIDETNEPIYTLGSFAVLLALAA